MYSCSTRTRIPRAQTPRPNTLSIIKPGRRKLYLVMGGDRYEQSRNASSVAAFVFIRSSRTRKTEAVYKTERSEVLVAESGQEPHNIFEWSDKYIDVSCAESYWADSVKKNEHCCSFFSCPRRSDVFLFNQNKNTASRGREHLLDF